MTIRLPLWSSSPGAAGATPAETSSRSLVVALVGPVQQENLALQYLASACRQAGHTPHVIAFCDHTELDSALRRIAALNPDLVGIGIAFQNNVADYLELCRALRLRGFEGHLTCGGHVPTFCYRELLRDVPELDSVVRHDGEETLVELLRCLADGREAVEIAGLVWRDGESIVVGDHRPAVVDLDTLAWPARSTPGYTVGGVAVDFFITARGCIGECSYCSIAAYTQEQKRRYRLRSPEAVAEEIAVAYHERGVRVAFIQDDIFVLPSERATLDRASRLRTELTRRGVGHDLLLWAKGRPETITHPVAAALRELGVIHLFLGIESSVSERLAYLGRIHEPDDNRRALDRCLEVGIMPSFNFMLFDPDSTLDDLHGTLALAEEHVDLPWNVCRTEIYSGTELRQRLEREGRLFGDYRNFGYRMKDLRSEVLFRVLRVALHEHALAFESLLNRLISLSFARQIHDTLFPNEATAKLSRAVAALCRDARTDTLQVIRRALREVEVFGYEDARSVQRLATELGLELGLRDHERRRRAEELWRHYTLRGALLMTGRGVMPHEGTLDGYRVALGS